MYECTLSKGVVLHMHSSQRCAAQHRQQRTQFLEWTSVSRFAPLASMYNAIVNHLSSLKFQNNVNLFYALNALPKCTGNFTKYRNLLIHECMHVCPQITRSPLYRQTPSLNKHSQELICSYFKVYACLKGMCQFQESY